MAIPARDGPSHRLPHAGGADRALRGCAALIRAEVQKRPDVTLEELCARVAESEGVEASPSLMYREPRRLRLPRKKSPSTTANGIRHG